MKHVYFMTEEEEKKKILDSAKFAIPKTPRGTFEGRTKALATCISASLSHAQEENRTTILPDDISKISYHYQKLFELLSRKNSKNLSNEKIIKQVDTIFNEILSLWKSKNTTTSVETDNILKSVKDKVLTDEIENDRDNL